MLHPLLESDICECIHKGKVIFPSSHQNFLLVTEAGILPKPKRFYKEFSRNFEN